MTVQSMFKDTPTCRSTRSCAAHRLCSLGRKAKLWGGRAVENHELRLEEDVAVDTEANAGVALDTTEAGAASRGGVVDVAAGHDGLVGSDAERDAGESRGAWVGVTALTGVVSGAGDLSIVSADGGCGEVEKRGSGVSDGVDARRYERPGADSITITAELPEAIGGVDGDVGNRSGVLRCIDVTKIVASWCTLLQVGCEERGVEASFDVAEECLLGLRLHCIDRIESQTEQAIIAGVLLELSTDCLGQFDGLARCRCGANTHSVGVNIAACCAAITIGDTPSVAGENPGC